MCVLPDFELRQWAEFGGLTPYSPDCINPASVDLRWSGIYREASTSSIDGWSEPIAADVLTIEHGKFYLLDTLEHIVIPKNLSGVVKVKSTPARWGFDHANALWFDPGFYGTGTLEVFNHHPRPFVIAREQRIVQLVLHRMTNAPLEPYKGKYNGQSKAQPGK